MKPWPAIASVIKNAADQLAATPASTDAFRLPWFVSDHEDDEFVMECIKIRLFGVETLSVMEAGFATKRCFYHGYSDFRHFPELDGAVLAVRRGLKLCVNSFSPRRDRFAMSRLYEQFKCIGSLTDPVVSERKGEAFIIGSDFTGKPTEKALWEYLRQKYGVRTSIMRRSRFDGRFTIPLSGSSETSTE